MAIDGWGRLNGHMWGLKSCRVWRIPDTLKSILSIRKHKELTFADGFLVAPKPIVLAGSALGSHKTIP